MPKHLISIVGPTAIGKTALSIALAKHFNCEIISCDSRQFYKEMRIGTAVPSDVELNSAKHHFIQNKSIQDIYNVGDFEKDAIAKLDELFLTNDYVIMVGGSGLYVNAVIKGFDEFPEIDTIIREEVRKNYEERGLEHLKLKLKELDANYFDFLIKNNPQTLQNPQRMMRFVEVCQSTNQPYSSFLNSKNVTRNFKSIIIGLEADREILYNRINQRVDIMMESGLLDEVKSLLSFKDLNALQTVGYKELFQYLNDEINLDFAIEEIKKNTRRFGKRQLTWFKRNENVKWFDYLTDKNEIINYIESKILTS
jgi:tRNA dimethylallyltransferase